MGKLMDKLMPLAMIGYLIVLILSAGYLAVEVSGPAVNGLAKALPEVIVLVLRQG